MDMYIMPVKERMVKVTDPYLNEAFQIEVENMLRLDADRLLAGFRETAARLADFDEDTVAEFMRHKERYGGWENGMIGGHTMGHYMIGLAQAYVNPGLSDELREKVMQQLGEIIVGLIECMDLSIEADEADEEGPDCFGFVFGGALINDEFRKNPMLQFDNVERGLADPFTEAWVPWYTMHKILAGAIEVFRLTGDSYASTLAINIAGWCGRRALKWSSEVRDTVLSVEYGGMNEALYELYLIHKNLDDLGSGYAFPGYLGYFDAAHQFDEDKLFESVLEKPKDLFDNVHANTTIPKFLGALARYEADSTQEKYLTYAERFWEIVVENHTYITGGNSEDEYFGPDKKLDAERTNVNNETCNCYNMIKLSRRLYTVTGKKRYLDYAANTLLNAIVASQNHETGFTTYFQPMGTGYQKVFNTLDGNFWCCTGTGFENFTALQKGIYYKTDEEIVVAEYISSEYTDKKYKLVMDCDFTKSDVVRITVSSPDGSDDEKRSFPSLLLRIPQWLSGEPTLTVDGNSVGEAAGDGFLRIPGETLRDGAEIALKLPMGLKAFNLPDGKNTYAFMYGPYVLSARLGDQNQKTMSHGIEVVVAAMKAVDDDKIKVEAESVEECIANLPKYLVRREGTMEFELRHASRELTFTTHYNQYRESYGIYWRITV